MTCFKARRTQHNPLVAVSPKNKARFAGKLCFRRPHGRFEPRRAFPNFFLLI